MSSEEKPSGENVSEGSENEPVPAPMSVEAELADDPKKFYDTDDAIEATMVSDPSRVSSGTEITQFFDGQKNSSAQMVTGNVAAIQTSGIPHLAPPPIPRSLQNISANGGAVGALVLGFWCLLGSFVTNWSIINGLLGLILGLWGLTSKKQKTAWIGIALCVLGILLSMVQISDIVNGWMNAVDETVEF